MIRDIRPDDFETLSALTTVVQGLHAKALPDLFKPPTGAAFPAEEVRGYLQQPGAFIAVYLDGDRPAGYLAARRADREEDARRYPLSILYIDHVAVLPDCRRRGIGRALLAHVRERAKADGVQRVALDVWSFNEEARAFFQACGFVTYSERMWTAC